MNGKDKQLQQIRKIRELRVHARLRDQAISTQKVQSAYQAVRDAQDKVEQQEQRAITLQRDGLSELVNGKFVNIDSLKDFNLQKLKSIKQIADAKQDVLGLEHEKDVAVEHMENCVQVATQAQKRLIGIEEVVSKNLWK